MKKISFIMALVILLGALLSVPVHAVYDPIYDAEETIVDGVQFIYRVIDNKYAEIVKGAHFVPKEIDGYPVTIIDDRAFWGYYDPDDDDPDEYEIRDWVIPDTVTYIGEDAFYNNPEVGTVKIPSNVTYIGKSAFSNCVKLKKINIPESIKEIKANTFFMCVKLKNITLHDNIYRIGKSAFECCGSLSKVDIPSKLESLGDKAFYCCDSLKSLEFTYPGVSIGYLSIGFDEKFLKPIKIKNFKIISNSTYYNAKYDKSPEQYALENGFEYLASRSSEDSNLGYCYAGDTFNLYIDREKLTDYKTSNPEIIKLTKKGKLTALQKGEATVKVTLPSGKVYKGTFSVSDNPIIKQKVTVNNKGKTKYIKVKNVSVKQGKTVTVKVFGKAKSIDNKYTSTSKAQIISKKSAQKIKIKGVTKGTSTVKIKVNGVKTLSLNVKVE